MALSGIQPPDPEPNDDDVTYAVHTARLLVTNALSILRYLGVSQPKPNQVGIKRVAA